MDTENDISGAWTGSEAQVRFLPEPTNAVIKYLNHPDLHCLQDWK